LVLTLSKPPYLRWALALALVGAALAWDLSRQATQLAPFAATRIERGTVVADDLLVWKPAPVGLLVTSVPEGATTLVAIEAGDPIAPSMVTTGFAVPDGWWTVPVDTPATAIPGARVRIILNTGVGVSGVVVAPSREDSFGIMSSGLVAVPEDFAADVALTAGAGQLTILYEP
jgi:hypothetical protein